MGLFTIFKKKAKRLSIPVDLGVLHTDVHSHLVPIIDDGSKSIDDSINMIGHLHSLGYRKLITTPHIMGDGYRNTPDTILGGLEKVKSALIENDLSVEILAGVKKFHD